MEVFAAFTAQTDHEVGRILDSIRDIGQSDNTIVMWEIGDNGASMEGTLNGAFNEMASLNGMSEDTSYLPKHIDEIGGPKSYNYIPVGWVWAMNTPFQWGKQVASHFGGTRNPLVVSWPARIKDKGTIRTQFHHVIDVVPTLLQAAGVREPLKSMASGRSRSKASAWSAALMTPRRSRHPVFRDARQSGALPRRLDRGLSARSIAVDEPGYVRRRRRQMGTLQPRRRFQRG